MKTVVVALLFSAQTANAGGLFDKVISACEKALMGTDRTPASVEKIERKSADHRVINRPVDGLASGALFLFDSSQDRIISAVGDTQELPMAELFLGDLHTVGKLLGQDFVVKYTGTEGEEISEFGKLSNYTHVNQSWVESIHLTTDQGESVVIPVTDVIQVYELDRI